MIISEHIYSALISSNVRAFPVDCPKLLIDRGYSLISYSEIRKQNFYLYNMCIKYSNDAFRDGNTMRICYNENRPTSRIRFSLMHELGHIILNHIGETQENEVEADYFASNILAPKVLIEKFGCRNAEDIKQRFGLSITAANIAWTDYRMWQMHARRPEDYQFLNWFYSKLERINAQEEKGKVDISNFPPEIQKKIREIRKRRAKLKKELDTYEPNSDPEYVFRVAEKKLFYNVG